MPHDDFEIRTSDIDDSTDAKIILGRLRDYNASVLVRDYRPLTIALYDPSGVVAAGVNAKTYWGWLYIEQLWVSDQHRRSGLGRKVLQLAEAEAVKRGCRHCYLDTFSFQAPKFYEKLGYEQYAKFDDFPGKHSRYFFKKDLV